MHNPAILKMSPKTEQGMTLMVPMTAVTQLLSRDPFPWAAGPLAFVTNYSHFTPLPTILHLSAKDAGPPQQSEEGNKGHVQATLPQN